MSIFVQGMIFALVVAVLAYWAIGVADDSTDWIIFGGIVLATVGFAIAINRRQYPTRKRAFTRDPRSRW